MSMHEGSKYQEAAGDKAKIEPLPPDNRKLEEAYERQKAARALEQAEQERLQLENLKQLAKQPERIATVEVRGERRVPESRERRLAETLASMLPALRRAGLAAELKRACDALAELGYTYSGDKIVGRP